MGLRGREDVRRLHDIEVVARDMARYLRDSSGMGNATGGGRS